MEIAAALTSLQFAIQDEIQKAVLPLMKKLVEERCRRQKLEAELDTLRKALQYQSDVDAELDRLKKYLVEKVDEVQAVCDADILEIRRRLANTFCQEECLKWGSRGPVPENDPLCKQPDAELRNAGTNDGNQLIPLQTETTDELPDNASSAIVPGNHKLFAPAQKASQSLPCRCLQEACRTKRGHHNVESSMNYKL